MAATFLEFPEIKLEGKFNESPYDAMRVIITDRTNETNETVGVIYKTFMSAVKELNDKGIRVSAMVYTMPDPIEL